MKSLKSCIECKAVTVFCLPSLRPQPSLLSAGGPASRSWEEHVHTDFFLFLIRFVVRNDGFLPLLKPRC